MRFYKISVVKKILSRNRKLVYGTMRKDQTCVVELILQRILLQYVNK